MAKLLFQVVVDIYDNDDIKVRHPDFLPGDKEKSVGLIIHALAEGIGTMTREHLLIKKQSDPAPLGINVSERTSGKDRFGNTKH